MVDNMKRIGGALALGACVALAACGRGNDRTVDTGIAGGDVAADSGVRMDATAPTSNTMRSEADIMTAIGTANHAEVNAARLALQKAQSADVKAFARTMVDDHSAMDAKGKALAKKLGVTGIPGDEKTEDMADDANDDMKDLREATGRDFDKKYMDLQVNAHEKTLSMLEDVKDDTKNPEILALVNEAMPKVQAHLDRAKALKDRVNK